MCMHGFSAGCLPFLCLSHTARVGPRPDDPEGKPHFTHPEGCSAFLSSLLTERQILQRPQGKLPNTLPCLGGQGTLVLSLWWGPYQSCAGLHSAAGLQAAGFCWKALWWAILQVGLEVGLAFPHWFLNREEGSY